MRHAFVLLLLAVPSAAQVRTSAAHQGPPLVLESDAAPAAAPQVEPRVTISGVDVELLVDGPSLRVVERIELANPTGADLPFELLHPLGRLERADAIRGLGVKLGTDTGVPSAEGTVLGATEARALLADLAQARGEPALLEHWGEALLRVHLPRVPAGATTTLELTWETLVRPEHDLARLELPLAAFRDLAAGAPLHVHGEIRSDQPVGTLYSPTHALEITDAWQSFDGRTRHHTSFRAESPTGSRDQDLLLLYDPRGGRAAGAPLDVTVLSERPEPDEDGFFLAVVDGLPDERLVPQAKNVVFVLDRSGSMEGEKLEQARAALSWLVARLRPEDRFNVVTYAAEATLFQPALAIPDAGVRRELDSYLGALAAEGGTNIGAALSRALEQLPEGPVLNQVVFLTDGLPTEGVTEERALCALVRERNAAAARVIPFGVGFDVNGSLLDRLAAENHGMSEYVLPREDLTEKVAGFYARMQAPLLLDVRFELEGAVVEDVFPRLIGDLYGGHQLLLTGRYAEGGDAALTISGRRGEEQATYRYPVQLATGADGTGRDFVARLWATRKIGTLVDELRLGALDEAARAAAVADVVALGTRYGILTEYTAFLADPTTDLGAFTDNRAQCTDELENRAKQVSGTHGVAQACNSKVLQRSEQAITSNSWIDASGEQVAIANVRCVGGKAFFQRGEQWLDSAVAAAAAPTSPEEPAATREVALWSDEFFALLDANAWLGRCVARTGGNLTVALGSETVAFN